MHLWEAIGLLLFSLTGWVCACWALWRMAWAARGRESAIAELRYVSDSFGRELEALEARERRWASEMEGWRAYVKARVAADLGAAVEKLAQYQNPELSFVAAWMERPMVYEVGMDTLLPSIETVHFDRSRMRHAVQDRPHRYDVPSRRENVVAVNILSEALAARYSARLMAQCDEIVGGR